MAKFEIMVRDIDAKGGFTSPLSSKENLMWKTINADDGRAHDAIYVYSGPRDFYVGQTVNFLKRHGQHYKNDQPFIEGRYDRVAIVFGQAVNGNLDALESLLIVDMEKDNQHNRKPVPLRRWNKTEGNKSQNKMQIASDVEPLIWKGLYEEGFVCDPDLAAVRQQDLMVGPGDTYPTEYERKIAESILAKANENHVVQGYAGTGKTFVICMLADRLSRAPYNKKVAIAVKDNVAKVYKSKFQTWGDARDRRAIFGNLLRRRTLRRSHRRRVPSPPPQVFQDQVPPQAAVAAVRQAWRGRRAGAHQGQGRQCDPYVRRVADAPPGRHNPEGFPEGD